MRCDESEMRRKTLKDVSAASGVSLITVSRALRRPDTVQEVTREKIHRAIKDIGYVPNLTARSLVSNKSNMIGVVVPILSSSLFADLAQGIAGVLHAENIQMLLGVSERSVELEEDAVRTFVGRQADAIIVTGFTHSDYCRSILSEFPGPVVETWNLSGDTIDLSVGYDNFAAATRMTEYLLVKGYQRIAVVGGAFENNDQARDRLNGFRSVMEAQDRVLDPFDIIAVPNPTTMENGEEVLIQLMKREPKPDAVFFQAELPAIGAIMACIREGISVPGDIAIAGFGDLGMSSLLPVPMTTVRIKAREIGERAARLVVDQLNNRATGVDQIDIGFELVPRESA